jgi:serine protease Do
MRIKLSIGMAMAVALLVSPGAFGQRAQTRSTQVITPSNSPYLGIGVRDIDPDSAKKFNLKDVRGAEITSVTEDSPAAKAGLKEGDVVLEFNGQPIEGQEQLSRMVRETPAGRQVKLGVWRNGGMQTLIATVEVRKGPMARVFSNDGNGWVTTIPDMQGLDQLRNFHMPEMDMQGFSMWSQSPMLGIMGESLGQQEQLAEFFGVKEGVLVKSVNRNSPAEKAGLKAGDVIVKVDETNVASSRDIGSALRAAKAKKTVTVVVMRNKREMSLTVALDSAGNLSGNPVHAGLIVGPGYIQLPTVTVSTLPVVRIPRLVFSSRDRVI